MNDENFESHDECDAREAARKEFYQAQPWDDELMTDYLWQLYARYTEELGPGHLGTCRVTMHLCELLIDGNASSQAIPMLESVVEVFGRRFDEVDEFDEFFHVKLLLGVALSKTGESARGLKILQELWDATEGEDLSELYRGNLQATGIELGRSI